MRLDARTGSLGSERGGTVTGNPAASANAGLAARDRDAAAMLVRLDGLETSVEGFSSSVDSSTPAGALDTAARGC